MSRGLIEAIPNESEEGMLVFLNDGVVRFYSWAADYTPDIGVDGDVDLPGTTVPWTTMRNKDAAMDWEMDGREVTARASTQKGSRRV